jgi:L-threonylcarbamoyladenylate synthase
MRTIRINRYRVTKKALAEAVSVLRRGGTVVFPTETSYGLAVDPTNRTAVDRLFSMKGRPAEKHLPLVASSIGQAMSWTVIKGRALTEARRYWPGPLTLVLPVQARRRFAWQAGTGKTDVAIRVPGAAWARALPQGFGRPVTSTSANISGRSPLFSGHAVRRVFSGRREQPDLLLDAGRLPVRSPSTVVRLGPRGSQIFRDGPVKLS